MNYSVFYLKHMIWIAVQALASQKTIKPVETRSIKQHNGLIVRRYLLSEHLADRTRVYQQDDGFFQHREPPFSLGLLINSPSVLTVSCLPEGIGGADEDSAQVGATMTC